MYSNFILNQESKAARLSACWASVQPLHRALALAQLLSFLLAVMGTTSALLANQGIVMPTTQSLINYAALLATFGACFFYKHRLQLSNPLWAYFLLALMDVEANFLMTKAYQYTSITSVTLLDCFTIPSVMFLSWVVFRARYQTGHLVGAVLCIGGLTVLVVTDSGSATGGPNPLLGDALVILGSVMYALCNVGTEYLLGEGTSATEMLACQGLCGTIIAGIQALVLERIAWCTAPWSASVIGPLLGFASALYCFYVGVPRVLSWSSSNAFNLSMLTSDFWAAGSRVLFFGGFGGTAVYFALAVMLQGVGLVVYARAGHTHLHKDATHMRIPAAAADQAREYDDPSTGSGWGSSSNVGQNHKLQVKQLGKAAGGGGLAGATPTGDMGSIRDSGARMQMCMEPGWQHGEDAGREVRLLCLQQSPASCRAGSSGGLTPLEWSPIPSHQACAAGCGRGTSSMQQQQFDGVGEAGSMLLGIETSGYGHERGPVQGWRGGRPVTDAGDEPNTLTTSSWTAHAGVWSGPGHGLGPRHAAASDAAGCEDAAAVRYVPLQPTPAASPIRPMGHAGPSVDLSEIHTGLRGNPHGGEGLSTLPGSPDQHLVSVQGLGCAGIRRDAHPQRQQQQQQQHGSSPGGTLELAAGSERLLGTSMSSSSSWSPGSARG